MPLENLNIHLLPLLGAVLIVFLMGFGVGPLMNWLTNPIRPENGWRDFLTAGRAIGLMEGILFTLAIIVGYPVFIHRRMVSVQGCSEMGNLGACSTPARD